MASANKDRERLREDLRALAKLANPGATGAPTPAPPPSQHGFATADSSGFVDLSKFSATDDRWVEKELARTRAVSRPTPPSIRPVSMDDIAVDVDDEPRAKATGKNEKKRRGGWVGTTFGLLGVCAVAVLAFTMARHPPKASPKPPSESPVAAAAPAPPPPAAESATRETAAPSPEASAAPLAVGSSTLASATDPTKAKHAAPRSASAPVAARPAAGPPVAAAPAAPKPIVASVPPPKAGTGDPLMDAIRASVTGKKK